MHRAAPIALAVSLVACGAPALAQQQGAERVAEGRVLRAADKGRPDPVVGQWVILHRVGSDRAAPLDSLRSGPGGRFRFRYAASGAADALYFVSATYGGIAYFSPPLRLRTVRGGDADIMVYDTTPDTAQLRLQGRHFVLSLPRGSRRDIAEIFEIENQGWRTVTSRDAQIPVWSTVLPAQAESPSVAPGDVSAGAVKFLPGRAELFAPLSPGVRQVVLTYTLPADAFPLSVPIERDVAVLEVLVEDPRANVEGAGLAEVAPATIEGRPFRRFLAQDVGRIAVMRINAPAMPGQNTAALRVLLIVMATAMLAAIAAWMVKRRRPTASAMRGGPAASTGAAMTTFSTSGADTEADRLVAELAALDSRFAKSDASDADARATYERERARLKSRIAAALAEEKPRA
jgi:hypothetical protein